MSWTAILATIGTATGSISLLMTGIQFLRTRSNLKVEIADFQNSFFRYREDGDSKFLDGYTTNSFAVIPVKFTNKSTNPITILDARIQSKELDWPLRHVPFGINRELLRIPFRLSNQNEKDARIYNVLPAIKLPLRLEAFDYATGTLRFPFFDKLANDHKQSKPFTVVVYTSRRTYRLKVQLSELNVWHDHLMFQRTDKAE